MDKWFGKNCEHQCCKWEENEETGGPDFKEFHPSLIFCGHKDNADNHEGNCSPPLCPLNVNLDDLFASDSTKTLNQVSTKTETEQLAGIAKANDLIREAQKVKAQKKTDELDAERKKQVIKDAQETARLAIEKRRTEAEQVADAKHRKSIEDDIYTALLHFVDVGPCASAIVKHMKSGEIPHVKIIYSQPRTPRSG